MIRFFNTLYLVICLSLTSMAATQVAGAGNIVLTEANYSMLVGNWVGTHTLGIVKNNSKTKKVDDVLLFIEEGVNPRFQRVANGKEWGSEGKIVDGKLQLGYDKKKRLLQLSEENGLLSLSTTYTRTRGDQDRQVIVDFQKQ